MARMASALVFHGKRRSKGQAAMHHRSGDETSGHCGGCLCGRVRYRINSPLRPVIACHCEQCRRTSGHFVAATRVSRSGFRIERDDGLRWYESSPGIHRGFCALCGSSLFWQPHDPDSIGIMAGSIDGPIGVRIVRHIHTATAGDYYTIDPDLPQSPGAIPSDPEEIP